MIYYFGIAEYIQIIHDGYYQLTKYLLLVFQGNILSQFQICRMVSHVHLYLYPFLLISTIKIQLSRYHYHLSKI
jgi:hypothetical protein